MNALTEDVALFRGLMLVGFPAERQKVRMKKNKSRFRTWHGADPIVARLGLANQARGQCTAATALVDRCLDQVYHGVRGVGVDRLSAD